MNAQTICDRILSDARADAAQVLAQARSRADQMEAENDAQVEADRVAILNRAHAESEEERANMLRMAQLEERKLDLAMKRQVLDEAFDQVVDSLMALPQGEAQRFVKKLLLEAADGECQIIVREEDAGLYTNEFLREVNDHLSHAHVTLSATRRRMRGGFVLTRQGMEINCAYDAVVKEMRSRLEAEAARALFE